MDCFIYTLASIAVVSSYPVFQRPRFEPQEINLPPEFALWPRQEPAPMYGYPDFGDYSDPRPAYSELDIVREQLAHPQLPPLFKRYPSNLPYASPYAYGEQFAADDDDQNLVENEVSINKPALEMLTEALMETLVRQSESSDNNYFPQQEPDSEKDEIVEPVKKSFFAEPVVETFEKTENMSPKGHGQKEVPMLRPPTHSPSSSTEPTGSETENKKVAPVINTQQKTKSVSGHAKRREQKSYVSTGDDLTKELNSLKKMFQ